jgi:hypothetical protein
MQSRDFESAADLINWIREKSDDIVEVVISDAELEVTSKTGKIPVKGPAAVLVYFDGRRSLVPQQYITAMIEDGIFERMKIKVSRLSS